MIREGARQLERGTLITFVVNFCLRVGGRALRVGAKFRDEVSGSDAGCHGSSKTGGEWQDFLRAILARAMAASSI